MESKRTYCAQHSLPTAPILSHINPSHALTAYFFKINFNIIPPLYLDRQWYLSCILTKTLYKFLFSPIQTMYQVNLILLDLITQITFF
jgi:hypothetical protein